MEIRHGFDDRLGPVKRDAPFYAATFIALSFGLLPGAVHAALPFFCAVGLTLAIGLAVIGLPWQRLPPAAKSLPAFAYFLAIVCLQLSGGSDATVYGELTLVPVVWLALYGSRRELAIASAATAVIFALPIAAAGMSGAPPTAPLRSGLMWSVFIPAIGFTLRGLSLRSRLYFSRSEAILRAAIDHAIVGTDAAGHITVFNLGAEQMLGYRAADVIGKATPVLFHDPDEIARRATELGIEPGFGVLLDPLELDAAVAREWSYVRSDGTRLRVMLSVASLLGTEGETFGYVGIAFDVSQLRQTQASLSESERRYRALAEAIPQMVWVVDVAGTMHYANEHWQTYTGIRIGEGGAPCVLDAVHGADRPLLGRATAADPAGAASDACEIRIRRADGIFRWHLVRGVPLRDADGRTGRWIVSATDIEQRKAAETILADSHEVALEGSAAKSRFLATMSHEIRTPMNGIIGMCELLMTLPLGPEQREIAQVVHSSGTSLLRVMNDILDFTKMDAGKLQIESSPIDIGAELQAVVGLQTAQAAQKCIAIHVAHDPAIPRRLAGDAGRLRQVVLNLVNNAIKFTPSRGSIEIATTLARIDARVAEIQFRINDTGVGMPQEIHRAMFDPFTQADGSITRRYGGTGLGLTICKQLVELMGGSIAIDPAAAAGTSIVFTLPLALCEREAERPTCFDRPAAPPPLKRSAPRSERILLAEDNPINALLAAKQLRHLGFESVLAENGKVAVAQWCAAEYDLVLMDCHMPEMDGFAATRAIRRYDREHPDRRPAIIVAMTADARAGDREACTAAGMDDYIAKPAGIADIDRVLSRWLGAPDTTHSVCEASPIH